MLTNHVEFFHIGRQQPPINSGVSSARSSKSVPSKFLKSTIHISMIVVELSCQYSPFIPSQQPEDNGKQRQASPGIQRIGAENKG